MLIYFPAAVLNQLQQELNYRFLQDRPSGLLVAHPSTQQVDHHSQHQRQHQHQHQHQQQVHGFKHPQQAVRRDSGQAMDTSVAPLAPCVGGTSCGSKNSSGKPGFKWCYAHVAIARQIQEQQQQRAKVSKRIPFELVNLCSESLLPLPPLVNRGIV